MAHLTNRRTAPRPSRAYSIASDGSFTTPRRTLSPPIIRRSGTRAVRANSINPDALSQLETPSSVAKPARTPAHYTLPPTVPSPFAGTLEASLDAVLDWGNEYAHTQGVVDTLLRSVETATDWPVLLRRCLIDGDTIPGRGRYLVEELLFLATRTLLPEQIAENRAAMARLYDRKKHLAIRLMLRYDMLRQWKTDASHHTMVVHSSPPENLMPPAPIPGLPESLFVHRRQLMPNIMATLIAAPPGGFGTHGVRERMKHHVTDLDDYLLLTDEKAAAWSDAVLVGMTSQILLQWQWLRQNNETLQEMDMYGWEVLERRADECNWIADDVKKTIRIGKKEAKEKDREVEAEESGIELFG